MSNAKTWDKETIVQLLLTSDKAVVRAIKVLYARQTAAEQSAGDTLERNARGFNSADAAFLTSVARALPRYNDHMTPRQLWRARRLLPKYWRQLLEETAAKGGVVMTKPVKTAAPAGIGTLSEELAKRRERTLIEGSW
ncbi:hypothetical protein [Azospirillum argentinense]|uniref:hypothetical protein n=1 Tax=Azospirillum argentinense TaxID=2970906 RepID=UPI0032DE9938